MTTRRSKKSRDEEERERERAAEAAEGAKLDAADEERAKTLNSAQLAREILASPYVSKKNGPTPPWMKRARWLYACAKVLSERSLAP